MHMKIWHIALLGALVGPVIGIPLFYAAKLPTSHPLIAPVVSSMIFLSDVFMPGRDMAGIVLFLPLMIIYCSGLGALIAVGTGLLLRKL